MENQPIVHIAINVALIAVSLIWANWGLIKRQKEFWDAIRGKDKVLQIEEIAAYSWIRIFPILVFADLFMGLKVSSEVWYSLDFIFFSLIAGNVGRDFFNKKHNNPPQE